MTKKNWTPNELDGLASALVEKFPERGYEKIEKPYDVHLTDLEFTPILQACLPSERHGLRPRLSRLKRDLVKAFMRIAEGQSSKKKEEQVPVEASVAAAARKVATTAGAQKIRWSNDEWRFYALALHTLCPELRLVDASDLSSVTLHKINLAASMMEPGRRRTFARVGGVIERLAPIYTAARKANDPLFYGKPEPEPEPQPLQRDPEAGSRLLKHGVFWTAEEYLAIAAKLQPIYPRILSDGHMPGLNITELNIAIRQALPPERFRRMANQAHIRSFGNRLRDALGGKPLWGASDFAQLVQATAPEQPHDHRSLPRTLWSSAEWDELVRALVRAAPQLEASFDGLNLVMLNEVSATMVRPRRFFSVSATLRHLEAARDRIRAGSAPAEPAPAPAPAPEPAAAPVAPVAKVAPAELADKMFSKIEWTREEWLLVAEELHRLHRVHNYPFGSSLVGLETEDVAFAQQRVLPLERQKRMLKVASFSSLKPALERAFLDLRVKLELEQAVVAEPAPAAEPPAAAPAAPVPPVPAVAAAPAPAAPSVPELPADVSLDPYRAAFAPLVALLAGEVARQLGPLIGTLIEQAVAKLPAAAPAAIEATVRQEAVNQVVAQAAGLATAQAKNYGDEKPPAEKERRLTVGILVNRQANYRVELEKAFPMVEIRIGDVSMTHAADRIANCDKVICMTKWVDHVAFGKLKKLAKERYVDCNGGMSDLKRIISIWLRSQGIIVEQAA